MAFDQHFNFGYSTVTVAPVPAGSGLTLTVADASTFTGTPPFNCTVWPANARALASVSEIVRVTAIVGNDFTITRDAEPGGITRNIQVGDQIAATITAKSLQDIEALVPTTPAAPDTSVQFNDGGVFGGDAALTWTDNADGGILNANAVFVALTNPATLGSATTSALVTDANNSQIESILATVEGSASSPEIAAIQADATVTGTGNGGGVVYGMRSKIRAATASGTFSAAGIRIETPEGIAKFDVFHGVEIANVAGGNAESAALHIANQGAGVNDWAILTVGGKSLIYPPTTDPHVAGALWNNSGLAVISSG